MDREAQQRIMGFFIEEARDHLVNLEQGLLSLQERASDTELINELFRGAHSIKGGAAMLGISSIQHTAHRMEDTFKIFREREVPVDRKLETLLLRCYDTLASLFDKLQSEEGLATEDGDAALAEAEPIFKQLDLHMKVLIGELSPEAAAAQLGTEDAPSPTKKKKSPSLEDAFQQYVTRLMREMLDLFKQADSIDTRSRLREIGQSLGQLGETYQLSQWSNLCNTVETSLTNTSNQLPLLARQILPALKKAQQQVLAGEAASITISPDLAALTAPASVTPAVAEPVVPLDNPEVLASALDVPAEPDAAEVDLAELWGGDAETSVASSTADAADVPIPVGDFTDNAEESLFELLESSDSPAADDLALGAVGTGADIDLSVQPTADLGDLFGTDDTIVTGSNNAVSDSETGDIAAATDDLSSLFGTEEDSAASPEDDRSTSDADLEKADLSDLFAADSQDQALDVAELSADGSAATPETSDDGFGDLFSEPEPLQVDSIPEDFDLVELEASTNESDSSTSAEQDDFDLTSLLSEPGDEASAESAMVEIPLAQSESSTAASDDSSLSELLTSPADIVNDGDFADLDALLSETEANNDAASSPSTSSSADANADAFADLEALIGDSGTSRAASPTPSPSPRPAAAPRNKRRQKSGFSNPTMRVEVKYLDLINNLVGEMVVSRNSLEQNQARQQQFLENLLFRVRQLGEIGQKMRDRYERSLLEASLLRSSNTKARPASTHSDDDDSHATGEDFDALEMDRFTAFHTLSQEIIELIVRVRESASDIQFVVDQTEQTARQFRQSTTQLQDNLNRARMVPFSQIADRLPRAIRDLSFKTGKQIDLLVEGRDTLIDKAILEELYDPMTHLVNNAIVHGIEEPQVREKSGKPAEGLIKIQTFYQGNQTIIVVSDDGNGIDAGRVKEKALKQGLLSEKEAATISDNELYDIIFHAGFSTVSQADELAGRGVGMDVVRTRLNDLRGTVQVDSVPNQGTTFTIRLPLTLSVSKAMVCVSDKALVAFPLDGVEEMVDISLDSVRKDADGNSFIAWQDQELILKPLTELFSYSNRHGRSHSEVYSSSSYTDDVVPIIILQSGGQRVAVQVDSFVEEQEIVIKQMGGPAPKPLGIAGATVLGDGRVLPIADILELIDVAHGRTRRDQMRFWMPEGVQEEAEVEKDTTPTVLIVDDSITVRELLSMSFNKVGYKVEQARDGQDAWDKLRNGLPCDLMFCDIEMPRMDGLELLSRMRKEDQYQDLPIAMLTSRGADRHRQMASELGANAYFTKPYLEEELLTAAKRMLSGETLLETAATS